MLEHWHYNINKCYNIDIRILINGKTLTPRVANWPFKFDGIFLNLFFRLKGSTPPLIMSSCNSR